MPSVPDAYDKVRRAASSRRVSVVVAAYNAERTLRETIDSLRAQSRPPDEIIVVDDGSTDGTAALLRELRPPVTVITQKNGGLAAARNTGCRAATGDFVAIIDSDDLAARQRIEMQVACLEADPGIVLCFSDFSAFGSIESASYMREYYSEVPRTPSENETFFGRAFALEVHAEGASPSVLAYRSCLYEKLIHGNCVHPPTVMFRRELFGQTGAFDTSLRYNTDWEWLVRASKLGAFAFIDAPLVAYRISNSQMSAQSNRAATTAEILKVSERLCALDPETFQKHEAQFRSELAERCLLLADSVALDEHLLALKAIFKCLTYAGPQLAMFPILAKAVLPGAVTHAVRSMRRRLTEARR